MNELILKKGVASDFTITVMDENNLVLDLTSYTSLDFIMVSKGGVVKVNSPGSFIDKVLGKITYTFLETDVNEEGEYRAYFVLKKAGIKKLSAPVEYFTIKIVDDLL